MSFWEVDSCEYVRIYWAKDLCRKCIYSANPNPASNPGCSLDSPKDSKIEYTGNEFDPNPNPAKAFFRKKIRGVNFFST